ncbi:MAG: YwiC-like family protein, partial [Acidimicrobiia bacterium]|nr:YwiC-like family protein [Acidimicrobiia bacterium]
MSIRQVAVPTEHGGWSLTLEPVILGLLVEPSVAGVLLGLSALLAFMARTPLRIVLVDRYRERKLDRTALAARVLFAEAVVIVLLVVGATVLGSPRFWVITVFAAPVAVLGLAFDLRSRSRHLTAELAGTLAISSVAAAIALAGGGAWKVSVGLWVIAGARAVSAIPYVRVQLRRRKGHTFQRWGSDLAQFVAVDMVVLGLAFEAVSVPAVIAVVILAVLHVVLSRAPVPAVPVIGARQIVFGL